MPRIWPTQPEPATGPEPFNRRGRELSSVERTEQVRSPGIACGRSLRRKTPNFTPPTHRAEAMIEIEPHPSLSGSAFDAVARGVAQGLGRLFPPIHLPVVAEQLEH